MRSRSAASVSTPCAPPWSGDAPSTRPVVRLRPVRLDLCGAIRATQSIATAVHHGGRVPARHGPTHVRSEQSLHDNHYDQGS
ncbi:hypothetical protein CURTO8I2_290091 [Curtobacterium sp. 8I-2]|nr:hypothetical protein CURTO8I2_290091 [Curtobacterium sp. 8I-2]